MISIRPEIADDEKGIRIVTEQAFAASDWGHQGESGLIDSLRKSCRNCLSLVAVLHEEIVGHILFTPISIRNENGETMGMGLAPMAVSPVAWNHGIGSRLVQAGLEQLSELKCPVVVVLGHPAFYTRFGFQQASDFEVEHGFTGIPQNVFFVRLLDESIRNSIGKGRVFYRDEFGQQHNDR